MENHIDYKKVNFMNVENHKMKVFVKQEQEYNF